MTVSLPPLAALLTGLALLSACAPIPSSNPEEQVFIGGIPLEQIVPGYGLIEDNGYTLPPVPPDYLLGVNRRALVPYRGDEAPGTIEIDPHAKFLYWVMENGLALRYPIAVGREGRSLRGNATIGRLQEWPGWTPTANMLRSEPEIYGPFAGGVPGGLTSPLGARGLYLYRGGRDTFYRIHGTNDLSSIGNSGSAGCIRMFNHDVIDLFGRVPLGTQVVIRTYEDSVRIEGAAVANRGIELPPFYTSREELNDGIADQRPPVPEAMINPDGTYSAAVLDLIARLEAEAFAGTTVLVPEDPLGAGTIGG
jgi:lipoprotein-anchoring transpeptidase ErfK/SrfK